MRMTSCVWTKGTEVPPSLQYKGRQLGSSHRGLLTFGHFVCGLVMTFRRRQNHIPACGVSESRLLSSLSFWGEKCIRKERQLTFTYKSLLRDWQDWYISVLFNEILSQSRIYGEDLWVMFRGVGALGLQKFGCVWMDSRTLYPFCSLTLSEKA